MNIVYIIGNGFDLNLGLKTSYRSFYEFYIKQNSSGERVIEELKDDIQSNIETWSDLELSLGKYTSKLTRENDVDSIIFDIAIRNRVSTIE